ncbi:MAG: hypothetical protein V1933_05920 [Candidatus Omnitrophota bacterium]
MNKLTFSFLTLFLIFIAGFEVMAADIIEEQTTQRDLGVTEENVYKKVEAVREGKKYKAKFFLSAQQGYDNNVFLDPRRKKDTFSEGIFDAGVAYSLNSRWDVIGDVSVHDISYWEATDASLVDTNFKLGFKGKLFANISLTALNDIEMVEYKSNDDGEFIGDKTILTLNQKLPNNFFHTFGYEFFYKNYSDRKATNGWGGESDKDRVDHRNTFDYDVGVYFKRAMLKLRGEYFLNKSNEAYHDYYDYESKKLGCSLIYLLTDKMSAYFSLTKQFKTFSARTIPNDITRREHDHGYVAMSSIFYDLYKNTTLAFSYAYRQNRSNNPSQKYSGSITTLGMHLRF